MSHMKQLLADSIAAGMPDPYAAEHDCMRTAVRIQATTSCSTLMVPGYAIDRLRELAADRVDFDLRNVIDLMPVRREGRGRLGFLHLSADDVERLAAWIGDGESAKMRAYQQRMLDHATAAREVLASAGLAEVA